MSIDTAERTGPSAVSTGDPGELPLVNTDGRGLPDEDWVERAWDYLDGLLARERLLKGGPCVSLDDLQRRLGL